MGCVGLMILTYLRFVNLTEYFITITLSLSFFCMRIKSCLKRPRLATANSNGCQYPPDIWWHPTQKEWLLHSTPIQSRFQSQNTSGEPTKINISLMYVHNLSYRMAKQLWSWDVVQGSRKRLKVVGAESRICGATLKYWLGLKNFCRCKTCFFPPLFTPYLSLWTWWACTYSSILLNKLMSFP